MDICLRRKIYTLDFYLTGRLLVACTNVKCFYTPTRRDLPSKYQEKWDVLTADDPEMMESFLYQAFEAVQTYWWSFMIERAIDMGLGRPYSAGRSGGYIIFNYYHETHVENMLEDIHYECMNCQAPFTSHADSKCLFEATWFTPRDKKSAVQLARLIRFLKSAKRSLKTWVPIEYKHQLMCIIDGAWEQYVTRHEVDSG